MKSVGATHDIEINYIRLCKGIIYPSKMILDGPIFQNVPNFPMLKVPWNYILN
jgi:hypothetical protein